MKPIEERVAISTYNLKDGCVYCGKEATAWDHIVPKWLDGPDEIENLVPSCTHCNSSKGKQPLHVFRAKLRERGANADFPTPAPEPTLGTAFRWHDEQGKHHFKFVADDGTEFEFEEYYARYPFRQ